MVNKDNCGAFKQELLDQVDCGLFDAIDLQMDESRTDVDVIVVSFERAFKRLKRRQFLSKKNVVL